MEELQLVREMAESGIIYAVGAVVVVRAVKQFLNKRNGKPVAVSTVKQQAQVCGKVFEGIQKRLEAGDTQMKEMRNEASDRHGELMRAVGRLEGLANGRGHR